MRDTETRGELVCVCVCVCVSMRMCAYTRTCVRGHAHEQMCVQFCVCVYVCVCVCALRLLKVHESCLNFLCYKGGLSECYFVHCLLLFSVSAFTQNSECFGSN